MFLPSEYSWLETFLNNDSFWFEDVLNWDNAINLTFTSYWGFDAITTALFPAVVTFTSPITKFSVLDWLICIDLDRRAYSRSFFLFFVSDLLLSSFPLFPQLNLLFLSDYQDFSSILPLLAPELIFAMNDFLTVCFRNTTFATAVASMFDIFWDTNILVVLEALDNLMLVTLWLLLITLFVGLHAIQPIWNATELLLTRLYYYIISLSIETRMQLEMTLQIFLLFTTYWIVALATFDDDQEESMEMFDLLGFWFFITLVAFLIYKYSIHYFAFLEATDLSGRSVSFVTKQFFRDFMGTIGLFLRFFILLFRLNVYDNLDDFYDSYYIFVGDFDDDEYIVELLFSFQSFLFYDYDANDDGLLMMEEEPDLLEDLFYLYFTLWGKFFFFLFFIVEELFRITLALYIAYLITFDVHAANCSYQESNYFLFCRSRSYQRGPFSFEG